MSHNCLILSNVKQANWFICNKSKYAKSIILTYDFQCGSILKNAEIQFIFLQDYLDAAIIQKNYLNAEIYIDKLTNKYSHVTIFEKINLLNTCKYDILIFYKSFLNIYESFTKFLTSFSINKIFLFSGDGSPLWGSEFNLSYDFHNTIISFIAEENNIRVCFINPLKIGSLINNSNSSRKVYHHICNLDFFVKNKQINSRFGISFYTVPQDYEEQEAFASHILNSRDTILIPFLLGNYYELPLFKNNSFNFDDFVPQEENDYESILISKIESLSFYLPEIPRSEYFSRSLFNFQIDSLRKKIASLVHLALKMQKVIDTFHPDFVTFGTMYGGHLRILLEIASINDLKIMTFQHGGIIEEISYKYGGPCKGTFFVWGEYDKDKFSKYLSNSVRIEVLGSLRHEKYRFNLENTEKGSLTERLFMALNDSSPKIIIFTAESDFGLVNTNISLSHFLTIWDKILSLIKNKPNFTFFLKPHPRWDYYNFYRFLESLNVRNLIYIENIPLTKIISHIDVGVLINNATSTILDCTLNNKPYIVLREESWEIPFQRTFIDSGHFVVNNVAELEKRIELIISQKDFYTSYLTKCISSTSSLLRNIEINSSLSNDISDLVKDELTSLNPKTRDLEKLKQNLFTMTLTYRTLFCMSKGHDVLRVFKMSNTVPINLIIDSKIKLHIEYFINGCNYNEIICLYNIYLQNKDVFSLRKGFDREIIQILFLSVFLLSKKKYFSHDLHLIDSIILILLIIEHPRSIKKLSAFFSSNFKFTSKSQVRYLKIIKSNVNRKINRFFTIKKKNLQLVF